MCTPTNKVMMRAESDMRAQHMPGQSSCHSCSTSMPAKHRTASDTRCSPPESLAAFNCGSFSLESQAHTQHYTPVKPHALQLCAACS